MSRPAKIPKEQVLKAIKGTFGIMSKIAATLQVDWHTADKLTQKWQETRQALNDEIEQSLDLTEGYLMKSISDGNTQDGKWYLTKKGKHRGYGDKIETETHFVDKDGKDVIPIKIYIPDNGRNRE